MWSSLEQTVYSCLKTVDYLLPWWTDTSFLQKTMLRLQAKAFSVEMRSFPPFLLHYPLLTIAPVSPAHSISTAYVTLTCTFFLRQPSQESYFHLPAYPWPHLHHMRLALLKVHSRSSVYKFMKKDVQVVWLKFLTLKLTLWAGTPLTRRQCLRLMMPLTSRQMARNDTLVVRFAFIQWSGDSRGVPAKVLITKSTCVIV